LVDMLTNLWRCHLHTNNLERFIFVSKNWWKDSRISSFPTNLVKFIKANVKLKEELKSSKNLLMEMKLWACKQFFYVTIHFFFSFWYLLSFSFFYKICEIQIVDI
jgi:hypothetical protein